MLTILVGYSENMFFFSEEKLNMFQLNGLNQKFVEGVYTLLNYSDFQYAEEGPFHLETFKPRFPDDFDIRFPILKINDMVFLDNSEVDDFFDEFENTDDLTPAICSKKWNVFVRNEFKRQNFNPQIISEYKYSIYIECMEDNWRIILFNDLDFLCGIITARSWLSSDMYDSFLLGVITLDQKLAQIQINYSIDVLDTYPPLDLCFQKYIGLRPSKLIHEYRVTTCYENRDIHNHVPSKNQEGVRDVDFFRIKELISEIKTQMKIDINLIPALWNLVKEYWWGDEMTLLHPRNQIICDTPCEYMKTQCAICRKDITVTNNEHILIPKIEVINY